MTEPIDLVCLDLAGTTVSDDGVVEEAFLAALDAVRPNQEATERAKALACVTETMGQSKIAVFRELFFDENEAQAANSAFEVAYGRSVLDQGIMPIEGAEATIKALRDAGRKVCLLTGFSRQTRDLVIDALGWRDIADLALCPAEAGRGRPYPDMVLTAVLRLEINDVARVAVVGDTPSDVLTGRRSGASIVAGVLTGGTPYEALANAGATHVLDSVADLPTLL
jgi:phosphoglycolate phosphatase